MGQLEWGKFFYSSLPDDCIEALTSVWRKRPLPSDVVSIVKELDCDQIAKLLDLLVCLYLQRCTLLTEKDFWKPHLIPNNLIPTQEELVQYLELDIDCNCRNLKKNILLHLQLLWMLRVITDLFGFTMDGREGLGQAMWKLLYVQLYSIIEAVVACKEIENHECESQDKPVMVTWKKIKPYIDNLFNNGYITEADRDNLYYLHDVRNTVHISKDDREALRSFDKADYENCLSSVIRFINAMKKV